MMTKRRRKALRNYKINKTKLFKALGKKKLNGE